MVPALKLSLLWVLGQAECPTNQGFEVQGVRNRVGRASVCWQGKGAESSGTQLQGALGARGSDACQRGAAGEQAAEGREPEEGPVLRSVGERAQELFRGQKEN